MLGPEDDEAMMALHHIMRVIDQFVRIPKPVLIKRENKEKQKKA
jgi:hypothetical protein